MRVLLKILIAVALVVLLPLTLLTLGGGHVLRYYINNHGSELLGREVYADQVSLNGFTGRLHIDSLYVAEPDRSSRFVSARHVDTYVSVPQLLTGTLVVSDLDIDALSLNIVQRDTTFNFSDILRRIAWEDTAEDSPLPVVFRDINVRNSYVHYHDSIVGSVFNLNDFSLFIPGVDMRNIQTSMGVNLTFTEGGTLQTKVDYDEKRQSYSIDVCVDDFRLESLLPYVRQQIYLDDLRGMLNLNLTIKGSAAHLLDFSLRGDAGIKGLDMIGAEGISLIQCDTVGIGVSDLDLPANRVHLSRVFFDHPHVNIAYESDSLDNFTRLIRKSEDLYSVNDTVAAATATTVEYNGRERELQFLIDSLLVANASLSYRDASLRNALFLYEISEANISVPQFKLDGVNHIEATARLGMNGRLRCWYDGTVTDGRNMHAVVQADHIDVHDFSPYTVEMFGNEVSQGTMSAYLMYNTHKGKLVGQNRITVRHPKVEKKRRGIDAEMNIPFRAGVYMLTDRNDVLDIDLPVRGNIDEPSFSYKRLLFRTLGKLIVKVSTSPFRRGNGKASRDEMHIRDVRELDNVNLDSIPSDLLHEE